MSLTLHIVSQQARAMGAAATFQVDESGAAIGRVDGNHWILPDAERFVSSKHATVSQEGGAWYITDVSTNGTFVNDPGFLIGNGHTVPLNDGDRLFIGDYEIQVSIAGANTTGVTSTTGVGMGTDAPFTQAPVTDAPVIDPSIPGAGSTLDPLAALMGDSNDPFGAPEPPAPMAAPPQSGLSAPDPVQTQDPMALFDTPDDLVNEDPSTPQWMDDRGAQQDHVSPLQQSYTPPRASNNQILDDWDKTHLPGLKSGPEPPVAKSSPSVNEQPLPASDPFADASIDSIFDDLEPVSPAAAPPITEAPSTTPTQAPIPSATSPSPTPPAATVPPVTPTAHTGQFPQAMGEPPVREPTQQQPALQVGEGSAEGLRRFLSAAGVDPNRMPPEAANAIFQLAGSVFREVVQGLMEVLRARDELKSELRIARTVIQSAKNNPLKFSVSTDEALTKLLFPQEHGYMAPVEALREAIDDIKAHQLAMTAGLSAALTSIMEQFEPDELEEQFDKALKHSPLASFRSKSKYWEMYQEYYQELAGDSGSNVLSLYGEDFAKAYQDQIDKLT